MNKEDCENAGQANKPRFTNNTNLLKVYFRYIISIQASLFALHSLACVSVLELYFRSLASEAVASDDFASLTATLLLRGTYQARRKINMLLSCRREDQEMFRAIP
jgi:hypothetical protein